MDSLLEQHVVAVGRLPDEEAKARYLQELLGPPSADRAVLQFRAVLMTALDRAQVWPHRVARESAFE